MRAAHAASGPRPPPATSARGPPALAGSRAARPLPARTGEAAASRWGTGLCAHVLRPALHVPHPPRGVRVWKSHREAAEEWVRDSRWARAAGM